MPEGKQDYPVPSGYCCPIGCYAHDLPGRMTVTEHGPHLKGHCAKCHRHLLGPGFWVKKPDGYNAGVPVAEPSLFDDMNPVTVMDDMRSRVAEIKERREDGR